MTEHDPSRLFPPAPPEPFVVRLPSGRARTFRACPAQPTPETRGEAFHAPRTRGTELDTCAATAETRGYVHVYTGQGKGKTTAAFGLALRAVGHGKRVYIGQFMKGRPYGEISALADHPLVVVEQFGDPECVAVGRIEDRHRRHADQGLARAFDAIASGDNDLVVLDELDVAVWFGLLRERDCIQLIEARPPGVELVITGRLAPQWLIERADLVTEMREVKHYYRQGVQARAGIEF
jgi:cob(I)alamin adenosyltransferase